MQVSGPLRKELRLALQACYPTPNELAIMVFESLSVPLQDVTPLDTMPTVTFNLIQWAIAKGRLTELVQAAAADSPRSVEMQHVAQQFSFAKKVEGEVERVVLENVGFENVAQWLKKLSTLRSRVCRIEPQPPAAGLQGYGTGFLLGPDVIVTNFHVRKSFAMPDEVVARFDFETDERGVAVNAGRECHLAKDAWLLAESPEQELDYALLRLVERAGDDPVHSAMRGFITPKAEPLKSGEPLLILQHPSAEPLKLSIGSIQDAHAPDQRLLYTANTKGGSSGSPCMNMALETVALHHFGAQQHNRGVLWSGIEADLRARGLWQFIG